MDVCAFCSKPASMECDRCGESYCDQTCQKAHWKTHRSVCISMPKLVPSVKAIKDAAKKTLEVASPAAKQTLDTLQRVEEPIDLSKALEQVHVSTVATTMTKEKVQETKKSAKPISVQQRLQIARNRTKCIPLEDEAFKFQTPQKKVTAKAPPRNDKPTILPPGVCPNFSIGAMVLAKNAAPLKPLSNEWRKTYSLEGNLPTKIRILNAVRGVRRIWVSLEIMQFRLDELRSEMKRGASNSQSPAKVDQNGLYVVHDEDNWHRAVALKTPRDNCVSVRFIDRGITKLVPISKIYEAWPALHEERAFAFEVLLLSSAPRVLDAGTLLTVRLVEHGLQNTLVVHVVNDEQQASMPETIVACGVNEIDLNVTAFLAKNRALAIMRRVPSALKEVFMKLCVEMNERAPDLPAWSKERDLVVIAHKERGWCRARVLARSRKLMVIFLIDFGVIEHLEHPATVKDCPEGFAWLPALTLCLSVRSVAIEEDFYDKFRVGGELRFQLLPPGHSNGNFEGTLWFEDVVIGQATISSFEADLAESDFGYWQQFPHNGSIVQILDINLDEEFPIVICPDSRVGRFESIIQSVYHREQEMMVRYTERPTDVIAIYIDENANEDAPVRRVALLACNSKELVTTIDLDSGKLRQLHFQRLFRAPSVLCHLPVDTVAVRLADMPQNTCKLDLYLAPFIQQKTPFRLACSGFICDAGGVELRHPTSDNSVLADYAVFSERQPPKSRRMMLEQLPSKELPTSDIVPFLVLDASEAQCTGKLTVCWDNSMNYDFFIDLDERAQHYVNSLPAEENQHQPVIGEACLAIFQEAEGDLVSWCRAVCTEIDPLTGDFGVTYIDYGNSGICNRKQIRRLPESLMMPRIAHTCCIRGPDASEALRLNIGDKFIAHVEASLGDYFLYPRF